MSAHFTTLNGPHKDSNQRTLGLAVGEPDCDARRARRAAFIGWMPLVVLPIVATSLQSQMKPWIFMWALSISIYSGSKWLSWWRVRKSICCSAWRSAAYLFAWPGMDARAFLDETRRPTAPRLPQWLWAFLETVLGVFLLMVVARVFPPQQPLLRGWIGMLGLIFFLHFGTCQIAALFWQFLGVDAQPIMNAPLRAASISQFWGKRWNLGFHHLAHNFIFSPLHKTLSAGAATFLVFLISGLIHDLVISVPTQAGYGLPTAYFLLQCTGMSVERSTFGRRFGLGRGVRGHFFTVLTVAAPAFWLFHPLFVMRVMIPFMQAIHAL